MYEGVVISAVKKFDSFAQKQSVSLMSAVTQM